MERHARPNVGIAGLATTAPVTIVAKGVAPTNGIFELPSLGNDRTENKMKVCTFAIRLSVAVMLWMTNAAASVIPIGPGAFGTDLLVTFTGTPDGTEVNGLSVGGLTFGYSLGNGLVIIGGGPGVTNNVNPPNIVSVGNNSGTLTIALPFATDMFGYGYAVLSNSAITAATTISIFNGATPLGTLSFDAVPDPVFSGGFAGLASTLPFDRVELTFNSAAAPAFAVDNIRASVATNVSEPAPILLMLIALVALVWRRASNQNGRTSAAG